MYHVPMCAVCGEYEVGTFYGSDTFCSQGCEDAYQREMAYEDAGEEYKEHFADLRRIEQDEYEEYRRDW